MKKPAKPLDSTYAPKGCIAVDQPDAPKDIDCCAACVFSESTQCGNDRRCSACERPDGHTVIFKYKEDN